MIVTSNAPATLSTPSDTNCLEEGWNKIVQTLKEIALTFFSAVIHIVKSLFFYLGSKFITPTELIIRISLYIKKCLFCEPTNSLATELFETGYSLSPTPLPNELAQDALKYARLYATTHKDDPEWLPPNCEIVGRYIDNGLKMLLIQEGDHQIHVIFGAKGATGTQHFANKTILDSILNLLGITPNIYLRAEALFLRPEIQEQLQGKEIMFSGQCFGGSLASFVALRQGYNAFCINSLALGAESQWLIGRDRLQNASEQVTHVSVHGDFASAPSHPVPVLDALINIAGIRTPGNFGKHFTFPHPPEYNWDIEAIHTFFLTSIIAFLDPNAVFTHEHSSPDAKAYLKNTVDNTDL